MSRMLKTFGVAAICLGSVVAGVTILRANDSARAEQERRAKEAIENGKRIREEQSELTPLLSVTITGNKAIPTRLLLKKLATAKRVGFPVDAQQLKEDVRTLMGTRWFFQVEPRVDTTKKGSVLTFKVVERPDVTMTALEERAAAAESPTEESKESNAESRNEIEANDSIEKVRRDNEFAEMVEKFNLLMEQKRFPEAAELAKEALELQPKNPVSEVMVFKSMQAVRDSLQQRNEGRGSGSPTGRLMFGVGNTDGTKGDLSRGLEIKSLELQDGNFDLVIRSGVTDPGQREALGKIIEKMKSEAADLEKTGRRADADQKRQVIRALEFVLQAVASKGKNAASNMESKLGENESVKADNEFADIVQKFNELMGQKRFPEAALLAKQARQLQPENPVAEAMYYKARLVSEDWSNHQTEFLKGQLERCRNDLEGLLIGRIALSDEGGATAKVEREIERRQEDIFRMEHEIEKSRVELLLQADEFERAGKHSDAEDARKNAGALEGVLREHWTAYSPLSERAGRSKLEQSQQSAARLRRLVRTADSAFIPGGALLSEPEGRLRELLYQWRALEGAAVNLKKTGLDDQSREMSEAAEKVRQEYFRLRHEAIAELAKGRALNPSPGIPPESSFGMPELRLTLTELRDQVQELRKEVGQLRELLEKKP